MRCLVCLAVLMLFVSLAHAGDYEKLGRFEKEAVDGVLKSKKLQLESRPEGKTVGQIYVVNLPVFSDRDGFLQWLNIFHVTTTDDVIRREVLLSSGSRWNKALVDETVRNLRDPILSNVVVVVPVKSAASNTVDVLVVTRDVWSLRLNTNFQVQDEDLTVLTFSLAENNLLGWRKKLALTFDMNLATWQLGPRYTDSNIGGTRLSLSTSFASIFSRSDSSYEGTTSNTTVAYPLWSLRVPTGGSVSFSHFDGLVRPRFFGGELPTVGVRTSDGTVAKVPWMYRYKSYNLSTRVTHSVGYKLKHYFSYGYDLLHIAASAPEGFEGGEKVKDAFEKQVLPRSEVASGLWVGYRLFTPQFGTYRDLKTFDLREDYLLGPDLNLSIVGAPELMGSDTNHSRLSASFGWAFNFGYQSYLKLESSWYGRLEKDGLVDHRVGGRLYSASPKLANAFRIVAAAQMDRRLKESQNGEYTLGGSNGLRGYPISYYSGPIRYKLNVELRSVPARLYFFRLGGVAFWEAGHVAKTFDDLAVKQDAGIGIRMLIPQINPFVFRVDWAFAMHGPKPGWPGRVSLGFFQAF